MNPLPEAMVGKLRMLFSSTNITTFDDPAPTRYMHHASERG
jgi:hypothetical protein